MDKIREISAQNPDPQVQQAMLWFTTAPGFIVITALTMLFFLVIFLIVGLISGAMMTAPPKKRF
jgi:hypothetical protein